MRHSDSPPLSLPISMQSNMMTIPCKHHDTVFLFHSTKWCTSRGTRDLLISINALKESQFLFQEFAAGLYRHPPALTPTFRKPAVGHSLVQESWFGLLICCGQPSLGGHCHLSAVLLETLTTVSSATPAVMLSRARRSEV